MAAAGVIIGAIGEELMAAAGFAITAAGTTAAGTTAAGITAAGITAAAITGVTGALTAGADSAAIIQTASDAIIDAGEI